LQPWQGEPLNDIRYQTNIADLWSDDELAAIGLVKPVPFVAPAGQVTVGSPTYQLVDGAVQEIYATAPAPAAPTPTILKSVVTARIIAAGNNVDGKAYIALAQAALLGNAAAFARWIAADQPSVNANDPDAVALVKGIGLDPAVILAPVAG